MQSVHRILRTVGIVLAIILLLVGIAGAWYLSLKSSPTFLSLPAVTTVGNHAGDPVNIAFVGSKEKITRTFLAAHWLVPDPIDASSTARIVEASVANAPYPTAPVSNLYLFGRAQDLAFELPTETVRNRHHVRLWRTNETVDGKPLWIGTASYDSGIELSGVNYLPTHHISPNVGAERDFAAQALIDTVLVKSDTAERNARPMLWGINGGGDWYFDDGLVRVLSL